MGAKESYLRLIELCGGRKVWIQTHNFPDPDAIASAFALSLLLEKYDIKARLCYEGKIDELSSVKMLKMLGIEINLYDDIVDQMRPADMIILVDCQKYNGNTTDFIGDELAVIDHHPTFYDAKYEYADVRIVGACASLIADYYRELEVKPSMAAATALLYGIRVDTLKLSRGVTEFDVRMYAYLFPYSDGAVLARLESDNMELKDLRAYGAAIKNIRIFGKVGFSHLDFMCPDALVAIISDFFLSLAEVEVVILFAKRSGGYKFSFRSERSDVDAGRLAKCCLGEWGSGGGHAVMAGGFAAQDALPSEKGEVLEFVQSRCMDAIGKAYPQLFD